MRMTKTAILICGRTHAATTNAYMLIHALLALLQPNAQIAMKDARIMDLVDKRAV